MDFQKIIYFEAVARLSSFRKASEELHITQPSITNAIKRLEAELDVKLFLRDTRNVSLTEEGEALLKTAKTILAEWDKGAAELKRISHSRNWRLRLGIPPTLGAEIIRFLYCDFALKYPEANIELREMGSHWIAENIKKDELELGYMVLSPEMSLPSLPVDQGEVKVLMSASHPLAGSDRLSLSELKEEHVIGQPPHSYIQNRMMEEYARQNITMTTSEPPGYIATTYNLVAHGGGIAYVLGDHYRHLANGESLKAIPLTPPISYTAGFAWKSDADLNHAAKAFLAMIKKEYLSVY
jgi:DNA-binding transcriptional LysR family regulator